MLLLPVSGLTRTTTVIGLTIYTLVVLLRNTVEGLDSVPARTKEAAKAMGTRPCAPSSPSSSPSHCP